MATELVCGMESLHFEDKAKHLGLQWENVNNFNKTF